MSEINKTAAATAIAVSFATLIAATGSEAAKTLAPQRGYCLLHNHGGADCSFTSKAHCEATAFERSRMLPVRRGGLFGGNDKASLFKGEVEVRKSHCFDRVQKGIIKMKFKSMATLSALSVVVLAAVPAHATQAARPANRSHSFQYRDPACREAIFGTCVEEEPVRSFGISRPWIQMAGLPT
jgi:hypothetical protein